MFPNHCSIAVALLFEGCKACQAVRSFSAIISTVLLKPGSARVNHGRSGGI